MDFFFSFLFLSPVVNILHTISIVNAKPSILLTLNDIFDRSSEWMELFVLKTNTFKSLTLEIMKTLFVYSFSPLYKHISISQAGV